MTAFTKSLPESKVSGIRTLSVRFNTRMRKQRITAKKAMIAVRLIIEPENARIQVKYCTTKDKGVDIVHIHFYIGKPVNCDCCKLILEGRGGVQGSLHSKFDPIKDLFVSFKPIIY